MLLFEFTIVKHLKPWSGNEVPCLHSAPLRCIISPHIDIISTYIYKYTIRASY